MERVEIMSAAEARKKTKDLDSEHANDCKRFVRKAIEKAIGEGKLSVTIDVERTEDVVDPILPYLNALGYMESHIYTSS